MSRDFFRSDRLRGTVLVVGVRGFAVKFVKILFNLVKDCIKSVSGFLKRILGRR